MGKMKKKVNLGVFVVATLALDSRLRQRGCKGASQEEAQESHHTLPGVQESVRE